jgi:hypothetical protein
LWFEILDAGSDGSAVSVISGRQNLALGLDLDEDVGNKGNGIDTRQIYD